MIEQVNGYKYTTETDAIEDSYWTIPHKNV